MVFKSNHADLVIPEVDIWTLLFERKEKEWTDDKGDDNKPCPYPADSRARPGIQLTPITSQNSSSMARLVLPTTIPSSRAPPWTLARVLKSQWNWKKGDVLGIFSPNSIDYAPVVFGTLWAGGVCSTANPTYTAKELAFQMQDSKVKGMVTQLDLLPTALAAAKQIGIPEVRIILIGHDRDPSAKFKHFTHLKSTSLLNLSYQTRVDPKKNLAFLVYSSGTTGLPKGVMLSHTNIVANVVQFSAAEKRSGLHCMGGQDGKGDKQLAVLPFYHVYGLTCILHATVWDGYQAIALPKFELEKACKLIQDYQVTFAYVPPPIILGFAKHPIVDKYDLSSLKWLNSGAAPLTAELVDAVWERLTIPTKQGYGLSETAPVTHMQSVLEWAKFKGSVGPLMANMEAKVVDLDGRSYQLDGELWVKGPNVFQGYLNRPELAKDTFSECGFFKTGDIGHVDAKGNFYITDRLKELIKYKGFQVAPAELEGLLLGHSDIADACVIPAFDKERYEEVPRAYVVMKAGVPRTDEKAKELIDWVASKVAPHKQLRGGIRFIDEVPKNPSGKILRRVLKEQAKKEDRAEGPKL
ncbi:Photinus-luciferin 4-monooxygenase (ATP-hydrolyzing) [Apiospora phragmitis]|uniref:Photinus-luciferin 4-monooxygenase (ATP-hydrolyzing) n=1 Tax=Apiospora phragmitis TaxID=2905665 RepID=A0ABR1TQE5_9PEZI